MLPNCRPFLAARSGCGNMLILNHRVRLKARSQTVEATMARALYSERFEDCISPEPNSGCWLWDGGRSKGQRGYYRIDFNGRTMLVHRFAYERYRGPVPSGLIVCHHCDVRCCVNPDHLFLGEPVDNTADMIRKGRMPRGERRGHAKLTDEQAAAIKASPLSSRLIAAQYGVGSSTIRKLRRGKTWTHIRQ